MSEGIPCMLMRGGTSKGAYFLAHDLPSAKPERDKTLLRLMGSPDPRQIDGIGGADPLTSKVAIVKPSLRTGIDIDYLFLQVFVDQAIVADAQNCGNILAGVAPFAIERGLVKADHSQTQVRIFMENTEQVATVRVNTPNGSVSYEGNTTIDGVPGTSAPILIEFEDTAGSSCGTLLPTGNAKDVIDGYELTCIDNGMPVVLVKSEQFGITGQESRDQLDKNEVLKSKLEALRLKVGPLMNLGDVTHKSVPKMTLLSLAERGTVSTRTFIPHRCHASIGVLGAVSVASACIIESSIAHDLARLTPSNSMTLSIEHPTGEMSVVLQQNAQGEIESASIVRTARKLFDGTVFTE
jgi:4-oxalomesaconate tautomerase